LLLASGALALLGGNGIAAAAPVLKVACIGEQTTHSDLFPSRTNQPVGMQEYPAMLQTLLGAGYNVMNYGDCCASVISGYTTSETHPFISGNQFNPSISFAPDIVIIGSWGRHDWGMSAQNALAAFEAGDTQTMFTKFQTDYDTLVSKYIAAASKPKIYCSTPIPIPFGNDGPDDGYKTSPAAAAITSVCQKYSLPIIDLFTAFTGHKEYYINPPEKDSEGEHTSTAGAMEIAQLVFEAITGADAGGSVSVPDAGATDEDATISGGGSSASGGSATTGTDTSTTGSTSSATTSPPTTGTDTSAATGSSASSATGSGSAASTTVSTSSTDTGLATSAGTSSESGGNSAAPGGSSGGCSIASGSAGPSPWASGFLALVGATAFARRRNHRCRASGAKSRPIGQ